MCESVAIVDRGRVVAGGRLRDVKRSTGRRTVVVGIDGDHRFEWLAEVPGTRVTRRGMDRSVIELDAGVEPGTILAAALARDLRVTHFELADASLEQVFIDHVGRPADEDMQLAPAAIVGVPGEGPAADPAAADSATDPA